MNLLQVFTLVFNWFAHESASRSRNRFTNLIFALSLMPGEKLSWQCCMKYTGWNFLSPRKLLSTLPKLAKLGLTKILHPSWIWATLCCNSEPVLWVSTFYSELFLFTISTLLFNTLNLSLCSFIKQLNCYYLFLQHRELFQLTLILWCGSENLQYTHTVLNLIHSVISWYSFETVLVISLSTLSSLALNFVSNSPIHCFNLVTVWDILCS